MSPESRDGDTTVEALRERVKRFVAERRWQRFHNPKNLAMSLAIEAGELMEHFQWLTLEQADAIKDDPRAKQAVGEELADCLAYVLALANTLDLDLTSTLASKMIRNEQKYPVDEAADFDGRL